MTHSPSFKGRKQARPVQTERILTGMGRLFQLLRFLHLKAIARVLFRKPRHVFDLYENGRFVCSISATWNGSDKATFHG